MRYLPLFLDVAGRPVLVAGGGEVSARKVRLLRRAGALVRLWAESPCAELAGLLDRGEIQVLREEPSAESLAGFAAVVIGDHPHAESLAQMARTAGIPINAVDRPDLSTAIMPAIVDRGDVVVGISSAGSAPVLARRLRERIEALLPPRLDALARFARSFRASVRATIPGESARRGFWERVIDGPIARDVLEGRESRAREAMLDALNRPDWHALERDRHGSVALVGAGPGDPDLLTLKALRVLQDADVVVHDRLVGPEILNYARRDAQRIDVGKRPGRHAMDQEAINALLLDLARRGLSVARLKGGDPFVFGRGGEEMEFLRRHGIAVSVVPGVTAAAGCAASAGIPLTHRGLAAACTVVTGHSGGTGADPDWQALGASDHTLAVYMGVGEAAGIAERLIRAGRAPTTPVAVIENGTRPEERVLTGILAELGALVARESVRSPALIVIGEVARLHRSENGSAPRETAEQTPERVAAL